MLLVAAVVSITTVARMHVLALAMLSSATMAAGHAVAQWFELDLIGDELYKDRVFSMVGQANALRHDAAAGALLAVCPAPPRLGRVGTSLAIVFCCVTMCVAGLLLDVQSGRLRRVHARALRRWPS